MKNLNKIVLAGLLVLTAVAPQDAGAIFGLTTLENGLSQIYAAAGNLSQWVMGDLTTTRFNQTNGTSRPQKKDICASEFESRQKSIEEKLKSGNYDINAVDEFTGHTPIGEIMTHHTSKNNLKAAKKFADFLIKNGANANSDCDNGFGIRRSFSPFSAAISSGNNWLAHYLIDNGLNLDKLDRSNGFTNDRFYIELAFTTGSFAIARHLVNKGANLNVTDENGDTPLHHMASEKYTNPKAIKFLVNHGALVNAKNKKGKTALDLAKEKNNDKTVKLLEGLTKLVPNTDQFTKNIKE